MRLTSGLSPQALTTRSISRRAPSGSAATPIAVRAGKGASKLRQQETKQKRYAGHLRDKNNFPERAWFENLFVCAGSLRERQLLPDNWAKGAVFQTGNEARVDLRLFDITDAPQRKSQDRCPAGHEIARRDSDIASAADHNDAAFRGEQFQVMTKVHVSKHFENEVCTPFSGAFQDLISVTW